VGKGPGGVFDIGVRRVQQIINKAGKEAGSKGGWGR